ncbi:MAG: hypothetical protein KF760_14935 [Candidatus Eremiobacteraeota bacterium]|nr:hypothetical protein [Candidatus Eremiobacteraeota bacterium]MCW5866335.1 hypothetical protein [Candidatus Eremiobacteraeota bacterium]
MKKNKKSGSALLMTLFFAVVAGTAASILLDLLPSEATSLRLARRDVEGSQVCEAGVRDCMAWISYHLKHDLEPLTTVSTTRSGSLGSWNWSAVITADPSTPPNPATGLRMYKIESTALWDQIPKRKVLCWLQAGVSFAKYAAFTDQSPADDYSSFILRPEQTAVDGSFRTNGFVRLSIPSSYFSEHPEIKGFLGMVTSAGTTGAGDGIDYVGAGTPPSTQEQYAKMSSLGKSGFSTGASSMALPASPIPYANAAYGSVLPNSPPAGVSVNPGGGIYIQGTVDSLVLSVDLLGNSVYTITQGGVTTKVTRVTESAVGPAPVGSRLVEQGSVQTVVPNEGTGVLYASGGISAVNGTVRGPNTLATDFSNHKDIEITGHLLRQDTVPGDKPRSRRDNLGLIASSVKITDDVDVLPRTGNILRLYANIFTSEKFYAESHWDRSRGRGGLEVFGSVISRRQWVTQSYANDDPSGFTHPTGTGTFRLVTDPNSGFFPPPLFPSSSNGQMEIRYWKETPL